MAFFSSEEEVYEHIGKLFQDLTADEELLGRFQKANTIVQYRCHEPDSTITVKTLEGQEPRVEFGKTDLEPEIVLSMEADTAHRFWLGNVNVTLALARGDIRTKGSIAKILKLVPLVKPAASRYQASLEAAGREDLAKA